MIFTLNGCYRSEISVTPANWQSARASIKKNWRIYYRYYDPRFKGTTDWAKMFIIKGMNKSKTLAERQEDVRALIAQEVDLLDVKGFNPITKEWMRNPGTLAPIGPRTPLMEALTYALDQVEANHRVKVDMKSVVTGIGNAAGMLLDQERLLPYSVIPVGEVRLRHLRDIFKQCYVINKKFTDRRYNRYKDYCSRLFKELLEMDAVEFNPLKDMSKKPVEKKMRTVLTPEEEQAIDVHLRGDHYEFWRFVQIFFYSDARETELFKVRKCDVDLEKQYFKVVILKGKRRREEIKQISDEVVSLWKELLQDAKDDWYLFSKNLKPGAKMIRADQAGRRWNKYVKAAKDDGGLGIKADLRALNHLHITKVSEALGIKAASASRSHTASVITMTVYDVNHKKRLLDEVKKSGVKFGG